MDEIAEFNRERWNELAGARCQYTRPALDLDAEQAKRMVDPEGMLGEVAGRSVLCLAAGGGQQSAAFGLLGARVAVLDLSDAQLDRDREAAAHHGLQPRLIRGDMRDLSVFGDDAFDVIWQAHSLNFVPNPGRVFSEVARVLTRGGHYRLQFTNPFIHGTWEAWTGEHYLLSGPYEDGEMARDEPWAVDDGRGSTRPVPGPREFKHTLSTVVNGLIGVGLELRGLWEDVGGDSDAEPGTWSHFKTHGAPWLTVWSVRTGWVG